MPGSHTCVHRHIPKMSALVYLHCPAVVFGRVSPQLPAEPDNCICCTVHAANWHMVKGLPQPGSQLRTWRHTKLPARMSEASEKKELRKWRFSFWWILTRSFLYTPTVGAGQLMQVTQLHRPPAARCFTTAANGSSGELATEVQRPFICLWP